MRLGCYPLHHHYLCIAVGRREHSNYHYLDAEAYVTSYVPAVFVAGDHCCVDGYDNFAVAGDSNNHLSCTHRYPSFDADNHYYSRWWQ